MAGVLLSLRADASKTPAPTRWNSETAFRVAATGGFVMRAQIPVSSLGGGARPSSWFEAFASRTSHVAGKPIAFGLAVLTVLVWAVTGPIFHYSDTWQLVINTGTTIVTFLMVFLIQNTQNRDTIALQLKLDELILATRGARDDLACIEDGSEKDIEAARDEVHTRAQHVNGTLDKQRPRPAGRGLGRESPAGGSKIPSR
jgi:low affinity Fe/Cu permease